MLERVLKRVHVNRISALGGLCSVVGAGLMANQKTDIAGAGLIFAGQALDCIDGTLARKYNQRTEQGARLDPLMDKVKMAAIGTYIMGTEISNGNYFLPAALALNYCIDYISQRLRGPIVNQFIEASSSVLYPEKCLCDTKQKSSQRANFYGKLKASFQNAAIFSYLGMKLYENHIAPINSEQDVKKILGLALIVATASGAVSVLKRIKLAQEL